MRTAALITSCLTALTLAAPTLSSSSSDLGNFTVTNFSYEDDSIADDWHFEVAVTGHYSGHPGFAKPVRCAGTSHTKGSTANCAPVPGKLHQSVDAYISKNNVLHLVYNFKQPAKGFSYSYFGHHNVTTGHAQPADFVVKTSRASAVG